MKRVNVSQRIPWAWLIVCGPFQSTDLTFNQTQQQHQEPLVDATILAFHHYSDEGLCSVPLRFDADI